MSSSQELGRLSGAVIAGFVIMLVTLLVIAGMAIFGVGWFQRGTADFRGRTGEIEQLWADPDHRIAARGYFYDACAEVQAKEDRVRLLESELAGGVSDQRETEIVGALTAIRSTRADLVRKYNVRAENYTYEQFRDIDLPDALNIDDEETKCVAADR